MGQTTAGTSPHENRPVRRPARERPDSRPARLMMGAGALAAVTVIGAGLMDYPMSSAEEQAPAAAKAPAAGSVTIERPVRYVRLKRGQQAPDGAKVIREAAPTPRVVVRRIVTAAPSKATRSVARSRQSGR